MRKYELTDETINYDGHILHRIIAVTSFNDVYAGRLGGFIEYVDNLSDLGNCWVYCDAKVYGKARILEDAQIRDFAEVKYDGKITYEVATFALDLLEVDKFGLDKNDRNILMTIIEKFGGGPVGLDTLAAALGEDSGTIEDVYEPYLVKNGFINRTPKGRVATDRVYEHFNIARPVEN